MHDTYNLKNIPIQLLFIILLFSPLFSLCTDIFVVVVILLYIKIKHLILLRYFVYGHVWGRVEVCTGFWWGSLRERDHWEDPDVDGRIILRWIFRKCDGVVGTGWGGLRIGTGGGHL
jgi:hypothetical protein